MKLFDPIDVPLPDWLTAGETDPRVPVAEAWRAGMLPDPDLWLDEWSDEHRILSGRASAEPGRYRTDRTPLLREIMRCLSPNHPATRIVVQKGTQLGASEVGLNWLGYVIHHAPAPTLAVQPTVELAKRFSKQRIDPMIQASPSLRERIAPARSRDSSNTMSQKDYPGGSLILTGANSAVGLRSMPARFVFLDECDAYPGDVDGEGDPVALAEARADTYGFRRKLYLVSTPTIRGQSRIEREYTDSDQRRAFVPCPFCGHMQTLEFRKLRWDQDRPETVRHVCEACGEGATEAHKTAMLAAGEWRPTAKHPAEPGVVGFHLSSLYSPVGWMSWEKIVREFLGAKDDPDRLRTWTNTRLGETWAEASEAPAWERLFERREGYRLGVVPRGGLVVTTGTDVQQDRLETSAWAWGPGGERWLIDHVVFRGGPHMDEPWRAWLDYHLTDFEHEDGGTIPISRAAVDSGDMTADVYAALVRFNDRRIMAVKGVEGEAAPAMLSGPTRVDVKLPSGRRARRGIELWTVATSKAKRELYARLGLSVGESGERPAGWVHLPDGVSPEYVKQLVAEERRRTKTKAGAAPRWQWVKLRDRNEALDCAVYARAALAAMGADGYGDKFWRRFDRGDLAIVGPAPVRSLPDAARPAPAMVAPPEAARPSAAVPAAPARRPYFAGSVKPGGYFRR